jgi:AraC-like DNA-binding protein
VRYREHAPSAALAPFVTCFCEVETRAGEGHRVLPDGAMDVLFGAGDAGARVIGPMTRAIVVEAPRASRAAGVRFRPGAAIELLGVAARELRDGSASAVDVWGAAGRTLDARLAEARDAAGVIAAIEAELVSRVARSRSPDARVTRAVALLEANGGELPIPAVAATVGVGERQLERLFDERVGYGPKAFARVARLQRATRAISRGWAPSWARLALQCGYADQAHLVREFRALTGVTPSAYAAARAMSEIDNPPGGPTPTLGA